MTNSDTFIIAPSEEVLRLDQLLTLRFPTYSRSYFQHLIKSNLVLLNGEPIKKRVKPRSGDEIEIAFALTEEASLTPENIPFDILYEDEDILAINKPAGMVVHPGAGNFTGTFVNGLLYHCKTLQNSSSLRPGIVHRLDKGTTGVLLAAKQERSRMALVELFSTRKIHKEYLAITIGNPGKQQIDKNIGRNRYKRKEMAVCDEGGKGAHTLCETLLSGEYLSLVRLIPQTGRTHQLRVHLHFLKTPILGDSLYGWEGWNKKYSVSRPLLHAHKLHFIHPFTGKKIELKAELPDDMQKIIALIG